GNRPSLGSELSEVEAARTAGHDALLHVLAASRAGAGSWTGHEPDQREEYETEKPDEKDQHDADAGAGLACVARQRVGFVRAFVRGRAAAGDRPSHDEHAPDQDDPRHLPPA